jgi:hypothetical protein
MNPRDRILGLQYLLGRLAVVVTVPLIFLTIRLLGYRIRGLRRSVPRSPACSGNTQVPG